MGCAMDVSKNKSPSRVGRPRKNPEGGQSFTIYLPKPLVEKLRVLGKTGGISHWIAKKIQEAELPENIKENK